MINVSHLNIYLYSGSFTSLNVENKSGPRYISSALFFVVFLEILTENMKVVEIIWFISKNHSCILECTFIYKNYSLATL